MITQEERSKRISRARAILEWAESNTDAPFPTGQIWDDLTLFCTNVEESIRLLRQFNVVFTKQDHPEYTIMDAPHPEYGRVRIWIPKRLTCKLVTETVEIPACEAHTATRTKWVCPDSIMKALKERVEP